MRVSLYLRQTREGLCAVGENCVAAIKFQVFTAPGARLMQTFFAQVGPRP